MTASTSIQRSEPTRFAERIVSIDVIRGVAIAGIFLINISYFLNRAGQTEDPHGVDAVIWQVVDIVALGKFHFVFAFLFGVGVFIFLNRLRAKGRSNWVYIRRMLILVVAGAINSALGGIDVLASYGVLALVLLLLTMLPRWAFVTVGIAAAVVPDTMHIVSTLFDAGPEIPAILLLGLDFVRTLGHMVLGFWLTERGLFAPSSRTAVVRTFGATLLLSLPIGIWTILAGTGTEAAHEIAFRTAMIPGLMYVTALVLLLRLPVVQRWLSFLRFYGRMAFSNYLGQTVIGVTMVPFVLADGHLSALGTLSFCLGVIVIQCVFSVLWLRWFRYGPMEWIWRCGTYLEITPMVVKTPTSSL